MTCPDNTCEFSVIVDTASIVKTSPDQIVVPIKYLAKTEANSDSVVALQFVLMGLPNDITSGEVSFSLNAAAGTINYEFTASTITGGDSSNGLFVIGHASQTTTTLLPQTTVTNVSEALVTMTIVSAGSFPVTYNPADLYIAENQSFHDVPANFHPVFSMHPNDFTYSGSAYASGGTSSPHIEWTGDANSDTLVTYADVQAMPAFVVDAYTGMFSGTWSKNLDAEYDGILNANDIGTMIMHIVANGDAYNAANFGLMLAGTATAGLVPDITRTDKILCKTLCKDTLERSDCVPCHCPDDKDNVDETDCLSSLFISDYQLVDNIDDIISSNTNVSIIDENGNFIQNQEISQGSNLQNSTSRKPFGIVTISYYSECPIDGYWLRLGNFKELRDIDESRKSGILSIKDDPSTECSKREWFQKKGGDPSQDANNFFQKDSLNGLRMHNMIAFGFPTRVFDYVDLAEEKGNIDRTLGAWALPPTSGKRFKTLTKIVVNPESFYGEPTLHSFRLVNNNQAVNADVGWSGETGIFDTVDGVVGAKDLSAVIDYVSLGCALDAAQNTNTTLRTDVGRFDAEGDTATNPLDIVDILAVYNRIVTNGVTGIVPTDCCSYERPGSFTIATTTYACNEAVYPDRIGKVKLDWTDSSSVRTYTIYRGVQGDFSDQRLFGDGTFTNLQLEQSLARGRVKSFQSANKNMKFEEVAVITDPFVTEYYDCNPPQNINSCADADNPEITYIIVASNDHGEAVVRASGITIPNCNSVPSLSALTLETTVNNEFAFSFVGTVTDADSPGPYGTCVETASNCNTLTFEILGDSAGGTFNETINNTGEFIYHPRQDKVGVSHVNYKVTNSKGCSAEGVVNVNVLPSKVELVGRTSGIGDTDYGKVFLTWERPKGKTLAYKIYRQPSLAPGFTLIAQIDGPFDTSTTTMAYTDSPTLPDPCTCAATPFIDYDYKVEITGFDGASGGGDPSAFSYAGIEAVTRETEEITIRTLCSTPTDNPNPSATITACGDVGHPQVTLNWVAIAGAVKYEIWRSIDDTSSFERIGNETTNSFIDTTLPARTGCGTTYNTYYRVVAINSKSVRSGDPLSSLWGTGGSLGDPCTLNGYTVTAAIPECPTTPIGKTETLEVCAGQLFSGTLFGSAPGMGALTFAEVGGPTAGLSITAGTGAFTYDASAKLATDADVTFQYKVTACSTDSINYTITLNFVDCYCPEFDNDEDNYSIIDINNLKTEYGMSGIDQPPFSLSRRGGQTLRNNSAYIVTSGTNIACPDVLSDGVPLAMSGLALWLDPSDANTVHLAGSDLSRIDDKSGNGHYFEAPAAINNPGISTIGTTTPLNAIDITPGGNQIHLLGYDSSNAAISFGSLISPTASNIHTYDLYMVVVPNAAGDVNTNYAGGDVPDNNSSIITQYPGDGSGNWWGVFYNSNNEFELFQRANAGGLWNEPVVLASGGLDSVNVVQFSHDDPTGNSGQTTIPDHIAAGSLNGGAQSTMTKARLERGIVGGVGTLADYQLTIGMDRVPAGVEVNFDGQIGEIIVYNRVLTTEERAQITTYLVDKWST